MVWEVGENSRDNFSGVGWRAAGFTSPSTASRASRRTARRTTIRSARQREPRDVCGRKLVGEVGSGVGGVGENTRTTFGVVSDDITKTMLCPMIKTRRGRQMVKCVRMRTTRRLCTKVGGEGGEWCGGSGRTTKTKGVWSARPTRQLFGPKPTLSFENTDRGR